MTVPEALEQLRIAVEEEAATKARRDQLLATIYVNVQKSEPTAEFAVALRDFVREEWPKLSAIEAPAAASKVTEAMVDAAHKAIEQSYRTESWEFGPPSSLARSILTAALKGDRS